MQVKIFFLDDEPDLCEIFLDEFSSEVIQVSAFTDPKVAIAEVFSCPPDVIFIDYRLPNTTGDLVANNLPPHIPKYLVTGDSLVSAPKGFEAVLAKPIDMEKIWNIIKGLQMKKKSA